jgi:fibronectin type 3 domain-containing protein/DNA-binding beta-propeller fold protein YncE
MTMTKAVMKIPIFGAVVMFTMLLCASQLAAQTVVKTLSGGPVSDPYIYYGNSDGSTATEAQFHTPCGIAMDASGDILVIADRDNNAIRLVYLNTGQTFHFSIVNTSLINAPIGVAVDIENNVFVLNYGNGSNGSIYEFDLYGNTIATNAVNLANVGGIALDSADNIYVTVNNNQLKRITGTNVTTIATIPIAGTSLQGIVMKRAGATAGLIAACDAGRNGIYLINPSSGLVTTNAGFHGAGDFTPAGVDAASSSTAQFNQPMSVAEAGDGSLIVADYGNNRVKVVSASDGSVNNIYGVASSYWVQGSPPYVYPGWYDGTVASPDEVGGVEARQPYGVTFSPAGTLYVTENYYDIIRMATGTGLPTLSAAVASSPTGLTASLTNNQILLTWAPSFGATSYNVERATTNGGPYTIIANTTGTNYTDSSVLNGTTYYYVLSSVSLSGTSANSLQVSATVPALAAPTNLSAVTTNSQVVLTWTASFGATSYNVERSTNISGPYSIIASTSATNYTDTSIVSGTTYYYEVLAVSPGGTSTNSTQVSSAPPIPAAPANLAATTTNSQVILTWTASFGATSYNVERSTTNGGTYTIIASTSATNYTDINVFDGATYYYVVSAVNASGTSTNSLQASSGVIPPFFSSPAGIAVDASGANLAIADHANNAIRILNLPSSQTSTFLYASNGISAPAAVLYDTNENLYVLNQNAGPNGNIIEFDPYGNTIGTNATGLNQPTAFTMDANGNIFVTEQSSNICVVFPSGETNTLVSITNANVSLQGIALFDNGNIAVSDAGNHVIWTVNPNTKVVALLTGKLGVSGSTLGSSNFAKLYQPHQLARSGGNLLVVADTGNNRIVTVTSAGSITNVLNSTNASIWFGQTGDPVGSGSSRFVQMVSPIGVAVSGAGNVFDSETYYDDIRGFTGLLNPPDATPIITLPYFNNPAGIAYISSSPVSDDPTLFIADAANNAVEQLDLSDNSTYTFLSSVDGITNPASVLLDTNANVFVLNQNAGANGSILEFDIYGNPYGPLVTGLNNPTAFTMDGYGTIFVAQQSGGICIVYPSGATNTLITITNANVSLQGIALFDNGNIAVSDAGNHVIWAVNPITKTYSRLTGQLGVSGSTLGASNFAKLYMPHQLTRAGNNILVIADYGNNRLVTVNSAGAITNVLNSTNASVWFGQNGDPVANTSSKFISMRQPSGVVVGSGGEVFASETYYQDIRGLLGTGIASPALNSSVPLSFYSAPAGIALNSESTVLYIADPTNNTVSALNLANNLTTVFLNSANGLTNPVDLAVDSSDNLYVLNQGGGGNGSILKFDKYGNFLSTNAAALLLPTAMRLSSILSPGSIYVTELNGAVQVFNTGISNTIATVTNANVRLQGITMLNNGSIVVSDAGNDVIWSISPASTNAVLFTGVIGVPGTTFGAVGFAKLNAPMHLAETSGGQLLIVDSGNNRIVVCDASGTISSALNSSTATLWFGLAFDPVSTSSPYYVSMSSPVGIAIGANGTVFDSEATYKDIRGILNTGFTPQTTPPSTPSNLAATTSFGQVTLTWSASAGAASYNIERSLTSGGPYTTIANNVTATSYTDTGLVNGTKYYYVVSAVNAGGTSANSSEINSTVPMLAAPTGLAATTNYNLVNLTWSASPGAASYNVKRSPSTGGPYTTVANNVATTSYSDTSVINGITYYYVVTSVNSGGESTNSLEVSATPPLPPVATPQIGYVDFPPPYPYTSVFHAVSSSGATFNNDVPIVIVGAAGSQSYYTYSNTLTVASIPDPTSSSASAPVGYQNGLSSVVGLTVAQILPNLSIKAIGEQSLHPNSAITSALFQFIVGNPTVVGDNAAQFTVYDVTDGAQLWYTTDGSNPTNAAPSIFAGTISGTNGITLSLSLPSNTNLTFNIMGFKPNYQPSAVTPTVFLASAFVPNTISFGFASGEASSAFIASPGQTFYAPVTLSPLSSTIIYSLQFNLTVTNAGPNPGPAITPNAFNFQSMLEQPNPKFPDTFIIIPPAMFDGTGLVPLENINTSENLMGIGWIERYGATNLYNTKSQDLIQYSQAHDTLFLQTGGKVIAGGYSFTVPTGATPGQTYQIQIGRPSATDDGIGAPGSDVFIYAPTNGSLGAGTLNAIKNVTVGSASYIVGDSYPFRWFNAGDFGDTNLDNADVEQVFQSAIYSANYPPSGSDFADSMDSAGAIGIDTGNGYLIPGGAVASEATLGANNDTSINFNVFGDGTLDVSDVYVTFRRSLDPSLTWYRRFWTNDTVNGYQGLAAVATSNVFNPSSLSKGLSSPAVSPLSMTNMPSVNFASTDFVASAGQVLQIPITASVFGPYPLRVAMLNISIVPLDGSPTLTVPISFTPNSTNTALGTPTSGFTASDGNANYAAAWLDSTIAGISNSAVIGTLTVTIPTNATSLSSYAIHFDHASGSPTGIASFPRHTLTGLITLSSRTNSTYNDSIPDSWRLRYFGTVNNLLSVSNADADGTGFNNWYKYVAGLDPTDPKSKLTAGTDQAMAQNPKDSVIYWPSMTGKQYVIQRSSSMFPGSWTAISTNTGTGGNMEIHDASGGNSRFYRVSVH